MGTMELSNGVEIPSIGYGTWQTPDGEATVTWKKSTKWESLAVQAWIPTRLNSKRGQTPYGV